jgi:para-aminobenzoate synthetase/4-amino-4-deoxychorismate lyase
VTGAPKIRTAEILATLEQGPRGVYAGAIGHIPPDGNASFNVAIRTAVVDRRTNTIEFGIGSGIVWDSDPAAEYEECLAKGSVLGRRPSRFELLETFRWNPGEGFALLERHLARLRDGAEYFSFVCDVQRVRAELERAVEGREEPLRVRLLVADEGSVRVEHAPLSIDDRALRVVVAATPVDSRDVALFHKTTNREVYERARAAAPACDDVILWNERQEVTESTVANVVVEIAGVRWTPPVECGLLAGTYRAELLERGEIRERVISVDELRAAAHMWLVNSVQGERRAILG